MGTVRYDNKINPFVIPYDDHYLLTCPFHPHWDIRLRQYSSTGSCAASASLHENSISSGSAITVFRHVVFGRLGFLLPCDVHLNATLGILFLCDLRWCHSHLNRRNYDFKALIFN